MVEKELIRSLGPRTYRHKNREGVDRVDFLEMSLITYLTSYVKVLNSQLNYVKHKDTRAYLLLARVHAKSDLKELKARREYKD